MHRPEPALPPAARAPRDKQSSRQPSSGGGSTGWFGDAGLALGLGLALTAGCWSETQPAPSGSSTPHAPREGGAQDASGPPLTSRPGQVVTAGADAATRCSLDALELYEQRIAPLFSEERPSTCSQCHVPGVDLAMFVRDTPCETMACLVEQGLVDTAHPEQSKILAQIGQAEPDSELITEQVIAQELEGFKSWITYNIECQACEGVLCSGSEAGVRCDRPGPASADLEADDPGGCDEAALTQLFRQTVYASRGRCSPCHFTDGNNELAPHWIEVAYGCEEAARRTYNNVVNTGYINTDEPSQSLLLLKPLAESAGGVEHGGGDKFYDQEDRGYVLFRYFVDRYAQCQTNSNAP